MTEKQKDNKIPLLVLVGPTAVGKSALALKIARRIKTDIISADSAQVYRGLDIGTAKASAAEQKTVKHHLINLVDPNQNFSVADYQNMAFKTIGELWKNNKLPFMVGGTGLYINAVIDCYAFGQKGPSPDLRNSYEQIALEEGLDKLYDRLKILDPEAASRIHPNDRRRIIRALEVYTQEGKPISEQVAKTSGLETPYNTLIYGLYMERSDLYRKIEKRVEMMIEEGWLDEVRRLHNRGYREDDPGMQILGYQQLLLYLQGAVSWPDTIDDIKKQTRNLAKRQLTWFRRKKEVEWIKITDNTSFDNLIENICFKVKDLLPARSNN